MDRNINLLPKEKPILNFGKGNYSELKSITGKEDNLYKRNPNNSSLLLSGQKQQSQVEFDSERNTYKGTVGQIQTEKDDGQYIGSGALISHNGRCLLLTCAHNLFQPLNKINANQQQQVGKVKEAAFHYQQKQFQSSLMASKLTDFKHVENYNEFHKVWEGFDIATAVLENEAEFRRLGSDNQSDWSFYECMNPKVGETIVVIGYPKDSDGKCYEMEGTILDIFESQKDDDKVLITYEDIITEEGQSGSPVFLKRGDQYTIIGVHVGTIEDDKGKPSNVATAITADIYNWIIDSFEKLK